MIVPPSHEVAAYGLHTLLAEARRNVADLREAIDQLSAVQSSVGAKRRGRLTAHALAIKATHADGAPEEHP